MAVMIDKSGLQVAKVLADFIDGQALPGTGITPEAFWAGAAKIFEGFAPENRVLLQTRDEIQARIDAWHQARRGQAIDQGEYQAFLRSIGYLVDEPKPFSITSERVDDELARLAGPQLVVPVLNARFLLNAANARWGSLYDALYGTDALGPPPTGRGFDAERGAQRRRAIVALEADQSAARVDHGDGERLHAGFFGLGHDAGDDGVGLLNGDEGHRSS